jgi:NitT/TauT family transport system substrate-binding protein
MARAHAWESQPIVLARDGGFFRKQAITISALPMQGGVDALQAVISGSADVAIGVGIGAVLRAYSRGAPVRILLPVLTGAGDHFWYVKADAALRTLGEASDTQTLAYSTAGSLSHEIVLGFARERGVKAKPVATGSPAATLVRVMSGAVDIGWAPAPFGLKEVGEGTIRIVARGADATWLAGRTSRVAIVNVDILKTRKDVLSRFARGYRQMLDWMYADGRAAGSYAEAVHLSRDIVQSEIAQYYPKAALQTAALANLDGAMKDAVRMKILDAPLTREQLAELVQIPAD